MMGHTAPGRASQRLTLLVSGKVKRVRFRLFVRQQAEALGLAGWVRNRHHQVEILAEGPPPALQELYNAVLQGPPGAEVDTVDARWSEASGKLGSFRIRWIGFL